MRNRQDNNVKTKTSHLGYIVKVAASNEGPESEEEENLKNISSPSEPCLYMPIIHHPYVEGKFRRGHFAGLIVVTPFSRNL